MAQSDIADANLFMMCRRLNRRALRSVPAGCHIRRCRGEELPVWKAFHFDTEEEKARFAGFMDAYFERVYGAQRERFFDRCLFLCDESDRPLATCFAWKAYGKFYTVHWLKVLKSEENRGFGRAILSAALKDLSDGDYPVYLHTQPSSYRAVKLYADFGFAFLTDPRIGARENHLRDALPYLERMMPPEAFRALRFERSDGRFSEAAAADGMAEF